MPLRGTLMVPGDKSITHRAIILSALADGEATISNYCPGEDCLHTAAAFQAMGVPVEIAPDRLRVTGKSLWGLREPDSIVDCGNSGTGIRLLARLLARQDFFSVLPRDPSLRRRPLRRAAGRRHDAGAVIAGRRGGELAPLA